MERRQHQQSSSNGTAQLYLNRTTMIASPTATKHNQQNYTLSYPMMTAPTYALPGLNDVLFRDRLAGTNPRGQQVLAAYRGPPQR